MLVGIDLIITEILSSDDYMLNDAQLTQIHSVILLQLINIDKIRIMAYLSTKFNNVKACSNDHKQNRIINILGGIDCIMTHILSSDYFKLNDDQLKQNPILITSDHL